VAMAWNGSIKAQQIADNAYSKLRPRHKKKRKRVICGGRTWIGNHSVKVWTYREYMLSKNWIRKKQEKFNQVGRKCEICGSVDEIHVHHKTYERLGNEKLKDLQVLCSKCHERIHEDDKAAIEHIKSI
jgi:uncharacterized protein YlaI